MSHQSFVPIQNHLLHQTPNNPYHSHQQHITLSSSNYPAAPHSLTPDVLSSLSPHYFPNQASQLSPFTLPLLNIMSPFSKQLFPTGTQLYPSPHCQLPPAWLLAPQTPPPTTPPLHKLSPNSPQEMHQRSSNYMQDNRRSSKMEAREIASATCLKAQEDFNMSACTDDVAIALTLCCSATTRLSSVIDDPPAEWDEHILHQLKSTRKRYSERWRGLYRLFILKKISAQPPSPVPDDAGKKTKVQLNQYVQSSDEVQRTPKRSVTKPLKSILKKPGRKSYDGTEHTRSLSGSSISLSASSCSLETLSTSSSSLATSFPPLLKETGTQTSPISVKQPPLEEKRYKSFPTISPANHYKLAANDHVPASKSGTGADSSTSSLFKSLQQSIKSNTESLNSANYLGAEKGTKNKENLPPRSTPVYQTLYPPVRTPTKILPMKRSTCFTPPPPRRFSPEENYRDATSSQKWTGLCTDV